MERVITDVYLGNDLATVATEMREMAFAIDSLLHSDAERVHLRVRADQFIELVEEN